MRDLRSWIACHRWHDDVEDDASTTAYEEAGYQPARPPKTIQDRIPMIELALKEDMVA